MKFDSEGKKTERQRDRERETQAAATQAAATQHAALRSSQTRDTSSPASTPAPVALRLSLFLVGEFEQSPI